jgi:hypothetical protein
MALSAEELMQIGDALCAADAERCAYADLRIRFPQLSWTQCDASDVTEAPFQTYGLFEIHLVDNADHCVRITTDPSCATGVVLAKRSSAA